MHAPPPPATRTDLEDLDRILDAKKPKVIEEELASDLLEDDDEASSDSTRLEAPVYVEPTPLPSKMPRGIPDPRAIVAQQKEFARQQTEAYKAEQARQQEILRQQEIARQAEIARQQEMARQAELARQQEIARQQEYARQQEIARQQEAVRQAEAARQQQVALEFERQEAELAAQRLAHEKAELARQQAEIARQKEELARQAEIARQQDLARQQALAQQAEELAREQQRLREQARLEVESAKKSIVVTPRDADPMSVSQVNAQTLTAPKSSPLTRAPETPAMATPQLAKADAAEDLSQTVQGVPAPVIPNAPTTSPVLADAADEPSPETKRTAKTLQSAQPMPAAVKISEASADAEEAKNFTQPFRRPSSIAPVAIDIIAPSMSPVPPRTNTQPSAVVPMPRRADGTIPLQRMDANRAASVIAHIPPPKENHTPWIIAACVAGLFLLGGGITAALALSSSSSSAAAAASEQSSAPADDGPRTQPRSAEGTGAKLTDPSPSSNDPVSVNSLPSANAPKAKVAHESHSSSTSPSTGTTTPSAPSPASSPSSKGLAPAPSPNDKPAPSPSVASNNLPPAPSPNDKVAPSAPKTSGASAGGGTGVIHVAPPLVVIVVDGQHKRAVNGDVVVTCGTHKIRAGMDTQVVNVPCGGAINL